MLPPPDFANEIEEDQAREDLDDVREQLRRCALPTREWFLPQSPDTFVFVLGATVCARCYLRIRKARWMNLSACEEETQPPRKPYDTLTKRSGMSWNVSYRLNTFDMVNATITKTVKLCIEQ